MPEHRVGTREEWQAARDELAETRGATCRAERGDQGEAARLPWIGREKYEFDTEDGRKTLADLFDGRSQLLAYNIMYGPDYSLGTCPGCTSLADGFDGQLIHLNKRDVTFLCFSRAPIDRLVAYKGADGLAVPVRLNLRHRLPMGLRAGDDRGRRSRYRGEGDGRQPARVAAGVGEQVGARLKDGLREGPGYIAFARENGTIYHTYTVSDAPDPFVAPHYNMLLERTPKPQPDEPRAWRKDEYPD